MKLIRAVERMEAAAAAGAKRKARRSAAWGICWSQGQEALGRDLEAGERLAVDVYVLDEWQGQGVRIVRSKQRATREAGDFGVVYGVDGAVVGHVDGDDGVIVSVTPAAAAGGADFWR